MKNKVNKLFAWLSPWSNGDMKLSKTKGKREAEFLLFYKGRTIGTLEYKNDYWYFAYSDEYKKEQFIAPIMDFPVVDKLYEMKDLPPFFASRIPSINQPFHYKKILKNNGDVNDLVSLLEIFGTKSINNPFILKMV